MTNEIDTSKVRGRRALRFETLDDIVADVDRLAAAPQVRALGNWSSGQVFQHLANAMNNSIDGKVPKLPAAVRFLFRLFMKGRFLTKPMSPGFRLPKSAAMLLPAPTGFAEGLRNARAALVRLQTESGRADHPAIGPLTRSEWDQLHCRHAELHLSFLISGERGA